MKKSTLPNSESLYSSQTLLEIKDSLDYLNWSLQNIKEDDIERLKNMLFFVEKLSKDLNESKAHLKSAIIMEISKNN